MSAFDKVSGQYQEKALVQHAAAEKMLALLSIGANDSVLDVACGPGHITRHIKTQTQGRVVGTDISAGMIHQAQARYPGTEFRVMAAESLGYTEEFDVVFCNSFFQWFTQPGKAVAAMRAALRSDGRIGVSCPATENWSTCFKSVAEEAGANPDLSATFARWKSPWFWLPDERSYRKLFESHGFKTIRGRIEMEQKEYDTDQAVAVFASGAAQGYTGKEFYDVPMDDDYIRRFNDCIRLAMEKRAHDGKVIVDFRRLYYVGIKT
ncbi:MAG: class I SAM-dependent methyltransferase [Limisphaerales bacterium]